MSKYCHDIEERIAASALGELSETETNEIACHLESCPDCGRAHREAFLALRALKNFPLPPPPPGLGERTVAALAAERAKSPSLGLRLQQLFDRLQHQPVTPLRGMAAAACGLMLFFGLMSIEPQGGRTAAAGESCDSNIRVVKQAIEEFRADHEGRAPDELSELIPHYLHSVPNCPHTRSETYSLGYKTAPEGGNPPFELNCSADHVRFDTP